MRTSFRLLASAGTTLLAAAPLRAQMTDEAARRWVNEYFPYSPASAVEMRLDHAGSTSVGSYQVLTALRSVGGDKNKDQLGLLYDPSGKVLAAGPSFPLPAVEPAVGPDNFPLFAQEALPKILANVLGSRVRVRWSAGPSRPTPVVAVTAEISSGFGWIKWPVAVTIDGKYAVLGAVWPIDRDPRAVRRDLLSEANIQWDPGPDRAIVRVVEFSDYQCPACKRYWGEVKPILHEFGAKVHHGIANFPLVNNHPWAFRAAVAGACMASLWPDQLLPFKEDFYAVQDTITLDSVDDSVQGYLKQHSLSWDTFKTCFMKDPAIDKVLAHLELGHRLGVLGTPVYYANGEPLAFGDKELFKKRLQSIIEAGGKPENAAEIPLSAPSPAPSQPAPAQQKPAPQAPAAAPPR